MRVVIYIRGEFFLGGCLYFEGFSEVFMCFLFFFFYNYLMYIGLVTIWHTLYLFLDIYMLTYVIHLSLHVLFLFSLYAYDSYYWYATFYFCFTLRCLDEFCLKCFRNTDCQSLSFHELSSCNVFQEFVL